MFKVVLSYALVALVAADPSVSVWGVNSPIARGLAVDQWGVRTVSNDWGLAPVAAPVATVARTAVLQAAPVATVARTVALPAVQAIPTAVSSQRRVDIISKPLVQTWAAPAVEVRAAPIAVAAPAVEVRAAPIAVAPTAVSSQSRVDIVSKPLVQTWAAPAVEVRAAPVAVAAPVVRAAPLSTAWTTSSVVRSAPVVSTQVVIAPVATAWAAPAATAWSAPVASTWSTGAWAPSVVARSGLGWGANNGLWAGRAVNNVWGGYANAW